MPRTGPLLLAGLLAAGCTAAPTSAATGPVGDADGTVVATDMEFTPERIEVVAGEPATIHLTNDGGTVHDLVLDTGWESGRLEPGQATTVTLDPLEETTVGWCSVPGHRAAGMELELVVVRSAG